MEPSSTCFGAKKNQNLKLESFRVDQSQHSRGLKVFIGLNVD